MSGIGQAWRVPVMLAAVTLGCLAVVGAATVAGTSDAGQQPGPVTSTTQALESGLPQSGNPERAHVSDSRAKAKVSTDFSVKTRDRVFFITIDDGITKSADALDFVEAKRIPVTVFLTDSAADGRWPYFRRIAAFGGSVQNHTMDHKSLTNSSTDLRYEICHTQKAYARHFGERPTLLRPPFGNGGYHTDGSATRARIRQVAASCGIERVVMWNAVASHGKFQFIRHELSRGDIVLFHFTPDLPDELRSVMAMARHQGLHPASLRDYLTD